MMPARLAVGGRSGGWLPRRLLAGSQPGETRLKSSTVVPARIRLTLSWMPMEAGLAAIAVLAGTGRRAAGEDAGCSAAVAAEPDRGGGVCADPAHRGGGHPGTARARQAA